MESLKDETFYEVARLQIGQTTQEIDARPRPSDALALAAQVGCPIYVTEKVFEKAGVPLANLEASLGPDIQGIDSLLKGLEIKIQSRLARLNDIQAEKD